MAFDIFLQIDGIKGDSTDDTHKDWIEVLSFSTGVSQAIGGATSAQGALTGGRADIRDFSIVKRLDSASPVLASHCCSGKHIPNIKLKICRAMGEKTVFMVYDLKDSIVSRITTRGAGQSEDPIPMEEVSLRFGEIHWSYTPTDPTGGGKTGAAVQAGWSAVQNKAV